VPPTEIENALAADQRRANQLGREIKITALVGEPGPEVVRTAREGRYDLIIAEMPEVGSRAFVAASQSWLDYVVEHAHCVVFLAAPPAIPTEVDEPTETTFAKPH
jgi:hypothetical protein